MKRITRKEQLRLIEDAIKRLQTAVKYGPDMDNSRLICLFDARELLGHAIAGAPDGGQKWPEEE